MSKRKRELTGKELVALFQRPQFSHAQMLEVTGLSRDVVLAWHARGFIVPIARGESGHGRRRYSRLDLAYLLLLRELSDAGVPLAEAAIVARGPDLMIIPQFLNVTEKPLRCSLVVYRADANTPYRAELLTPSDVPIEQFMEHFGLIHVKVFDIYSLSRRLFARIYEVQHPAK